jgi:hypothetical protein
MYISPTPVKLSASTVQKIVEAIAILEAFKSVLPPLPIPFLLKRYPDHWEVEQLQGDTTVVTTFSGPDAESMARAFATSN